MNRIITPIILGTLVQAIFLVVMLIMAWDFTYLELAATWTSFICTLMCVFQSRWNYVVGVISVFFLSIVFYQANLLGSMALNIYLIPTLIYGWFVWKKDSETKPVERLKAENILLYLIASGLTYLGAVMTVSYFGGNIPTLDGFLLIGSILAQFLLDRKKLETWMVWAAVNVISIYVYYNSGLYLITLQFCFFLGNTVYGYVMWKKSMENKSMENNSGTA